MKHIVSLLAAAAISLPGREEMMRALSEEAMIGSLPEPRPALAALAPPRRLELGKFVAAAENSILSLVFAALTLLPLAEILLRSVGGIGFEGSSALVATLLGALLFAVIGGAARLLL